MCACVGLRSTFISSCQTLCGVTPSRVRNRERGSARPKKWSSQSRAGRSGDAAYGLEFAYRIRELFLYNIDYESLETLISYFLPDDKMAIEVFPISFLISYILLF